MHSNAGENDVDEDSNGDTDSSNILTPVRMQTASYTQLKMKFEPNSKI